MSTDPDDEGFLELPPKSTPPVQTQGSTGLTERQMDMVVSGGVQVATGAAEVVKTAFEIWKIRSAARGQVEVIDAETRQLRERLSGDLETMRQQRKTIRTRGQEVREILREAPAILRAEPDAAVRATFIEQLPRIIEEALRGTS